MLQSLSLSADETMFFLSFLHFYKINNIRLKKGTNEHRMYLEVYYNNELFKIKFISEEF